MRFSEEEAQPTVLRLRRARGQLDAVIRMLEEGADCRDVVTQLAASTKAIDRAAFTLMSTGMRKCLSTSDGDNLDEKALEKLFLSLA
ncbi:metal-sensing transcriptional repressor [Corynebacterium poyangense]|uniref:Metal-sensing transcriptional repressor n=1 Tax=Corynebacterium poyangense TaxID=2684405 RepID=A0A7H0SQ56_9CORY|nr:metal-sensitive transcriptional regulator [Corynebacterium poyangense]MBZ8178382.1 metal-sensing transcriptional repressor [Corynebacterium poyangense]QNQ90681.1 metal-sensing transcriptional repressor [Corynebacterium poyangense]